MKAHPASQHLSLSGVREIPLTKGYVAIVGEADFDWLSQWNWCVNSQGYAVRCVRNHPNPQRMIYMHRELVPAPAGRFTDHADRNRLNNVRSNLRVADFSENVANRPYRNSSGFRGVISEGRKWRARVTMRGVHYQLGLFESAEDAARARDMKAREIQGAFAFLNFPEAA